MHAFPSGTLALDFVGTLRVRRQPVPLEQLSSPMLLDAWFVESGLLDEEPASTEGDLRAAVKLRESIYSLVKARLTGAPLPADAVAVVNRQASGAPELIQLGFGGRALRSGSAAQGLASIARQSVEIIGGDDGALLRECGRSMCTQVYVDRSRGRRREWCAMRTCGNRAKASAYRARHRGTVEKAGV
ncbi:MAG TPA: ABATE domain-containing protein [Glaciibacter sp.]|nr:ABATE domain-containing protein [Glaciibacter sp.]